MKMGTETKEGDIRAVIHLITSEYLGLDYSPVKDGFKPLFLLSLITPS